MNKFLFHKIDYCANMKISNFNLESGDILLNEVQKLMPFQEYLEVIRSDSSNCIIHISI